MPRIAYVNGRYVPHHAAAVHIEDRGYQFADGIYEVIGCIGGHLADERGHLDRLERSLRELKIRMPMPRKALSLVIRETLRRSRLTDAFIYIQVTRGAARRDFAFPPPGTRPSLIVTVRSFKFDGNPKVRDGVKVVTVPDIRWKRRDIKTTGLLAQALAKQEALDRGAFDAWMVDEEGFVTEGSSSNAWIVTKKGAIVTRPAGCPDILRGVTRTALLALEKKIEERPFTVNEAYAAAEAFTSSATALIMPVIEIDGHKIGNGKPGPVARKFYEDYRAYVQAGKKQMPWKA